MANIIDSLTLGGNTGVLSIPYAVCETAAATAAKTATVTNFSLETGAQVRIKFTYANTVASPTLNINSAGAKAIHWHSVTLPSSQYWVAGSVLDFVYNGTQWDLIGVAVDNNTNTTYGVATSSTLGLIKSGTDITVDSSGNVSVNDDSHNHVISNIDNLQTTLDTYMTKVNPTGTGSFSLNRWENTIVGDYSATEGHSNLASGYASHAEGEISQATGGYSHAEGYNTTASGDGTHSEGYQTRATGDYCHAEGGYTLASGYASHAEGEGTKASSNHQHVQGRYNVEDTTITYAHIVGNGTGSNKSSNAHTLDWGGNAWFAGNVYVSSTSGTNMDEGSKRLLTVDDLDSYEFITTEDIDEICGASIQSASELTF